MRPSIATILFTDLVNSTALMQRVGDERAQGIFQAHHRVLQDAVTANGGDELQWLGDGQMVAFASPADAVRCAIAMQQAAPRPVAGERMQMRVGLNVGEILRQETGGGYFGTPVVTARRLCDAAGAGQILCSSTLAGLLAGRQAFRFRDLGPQGLKGIADPVGVCEVLYEAEQPTAFLTRTPFVGRRDELGRLGQRLALARGGEGSLVMLVGEPGIGKTRTAEELAEVARSEGARVLWGRCYEGEWAPPYGPFVEAIEAHVRSAALDELRADLGYGAAPIARLVPLLRERLPETLEPTPLHSDEERFRLLDAVAQFLIAASARAPLVLVLDDLHWADRATIMMLRHVARVARRHRLLVLGMYRDIELDRQHPLADALGALRREAEYDRIALRGLDGAEVGTLLETIAAQEVNPALVRAIGEETDGNPFFIRETLIHLVEEGKLYREGGLWKSNAQSIADLGIPEGVRQVITRRLSRLGEAANRLLTVASAFNGAFRFDVAASVSGLGTQAALDALDEALGAQVLRPSGEADTYDFTHALIRHTLYGELNPSRQVRLHRQIAEAMAGACADRSADVAYHFHRSAAIPGAERGAAYALTTADRAAAAYAWDEVVSFLRMALDLLPEGDAARPRVLGRLAVALAATTAFDEALAVARRASAEIGASEGSAAATDFLAEAAWSMWSEGFQRGGWELATKGLESIGGRRDLAWVRLRYIDLWPRDEGEDPGIMLPTPERLELLRVAQDLARDDASLITAAWLTVGVPPFSSRPEALEYAKTEGDTEWALLQRAAFQLFWIGDYRGSAEAWEKFTLGKERQGALGHALAGWAFVARSHLALGDFAAAAAAHERASALAGRLTRASQYTRQVDGAADEWREALGKGWEEAITQFATLAQEPIPEDRWVLAAIQSALARSYAWLGKADLALPLVEAALPALERAPGSAGNYARIACTAAETLWRLERTDHVELIERSLREKVVAPDFRYPMVDGRLALAWVCALTGRHDEAGRWFAESRRVLDGQGARPLRAIVDFDEGLMHHRRGDRGRARAALEQARRRFEEIGMTGWARRAEDLVRSVGVA